MEHQTEEKDSYSTVIALTHRASPVINKRRCATHQWILFMTGASTSRRSQQSRSGKSKAEIYINTRNTFCRTWSLSNATFSFGTSASWRSSSSKSAAVYKMSSKSDDFSLRYGDITIFKNTNGRLAIPALAGLLVKIAKDRHRNRTKKNAENNKKCGRRVRPTWYAPACL